MGFKVGVGKSEFAALREAQNYYVDKTEIIYELVEQTDNEVTLFTRPRRFGKTLMMSMIENFFNVRKNSKNIFEGLDITKHKEFCEKYMNKYPVVFISFKDVEALNFDNAYGMLKMTIANFCNKITDLMSNEKITKRDRDLFNRLLDRTADYEEIKTSLKNIMRIMNAVYGKKVILLIDEYDVPLARASESGIESDYYKKMLDLIRGIISSALKDNEYLEFAVITGCLRIAKESIFTGTNNFASYSVIDEEFSNYFGFTQDEIDKMLIVAGKTEKADEIKDWYDGYIFGNSYIYCPWDVVNYISALNKNENAKPKNYWNNTSHNGVLLTFIEAKNLRVKGKFEKLLNGGTITQSISDQITYNIKNNTEDNFWSILLMTGYLTKADPKDNGDKIALKIPNKEIAVIFEDTVVQYFIKNKDLTLQKTMIKAFFNGDETTVTRTISDLLWKTISYNNYHENYYHAFLTGLFVGCGYEVNTDKEAGLGRFDIELLDEDTRTAIIIETKKSQKEADMEKDCKNALNQIITRKYANDTSLKGYKTILCYGIAFFEKQALVKLLV